MVNSQSPTTTLSLLHLISQFGTIELSATEDLNRSESIENNVLIVECVMPHSIQSDDVVGRTAQTLDDIPNPETN